MKNGWMIGGHMHKIKTFLVALVIILIALTSLQGIVIAAQVQRIHKNQRFVFIDAGTKDGFVMGATVCIYTSSGKKFTCGQVQKTSESKAMIRISREKVIHIKGGMEARLINEERR
jgi:hypothetical protein